MHFIPFSQQLIKFNKFNTFLYNKNTKVIFYLSSNTIIILKLRFSMQPHTCDIVMAVIT